MAKKIIKVEETKKPKIDLDKIKDVIIENKDTIAKIVDIAGDFLDDDKEVVKKTKKASSSKSSKGNSNKSTNKKSSKSSGSNDLSTVIDLAEKLLK